jgi:hypothetical protein
MNSDMEDNSDFLYHQLLNWLEQKSTADPSCTEPSRESEASDFSGEEQGEGSPDRLESMLDVKQPELLDLDNDFPNLLDDPLDWEEDEEIISQFGGSAQYAQPLDMGEIPIVQKRFQALLKRRLQTEIERHPPRFPWETEISDYLPNYSDDMGRPIVPPRQFWIPQLLDLLSVEIPETLLGQLLDACTEVINSLRPLEAKTVSAASQLFPDRLPALNEIAGQIRLSLASSRLPQQEQAERRRELEASFPRDYQAATAEQQMALSLLAAHEIINRLTLTLSSEQPAIERQWQTTAGLLLVRSEYSPPVEKAENHPLRISARLPKGGSLTLQTNQESATAERTYPGALSVELFDWQRGQIYPVEVRLAGSPQKPLTFAVVCR